MEKDGEVQLLIPTNTWEETRSGLTLDLFPNLHVLKGLTPELGETEAMAETPQGEDVL